MISRKGFSLLKIWFSIYLLAIIIVLYIFLDSAASNFLRAVDNHHILIAKELNKLQSHYFRQLNFLKDSLDSKELNKKQIDHFFNSKFAKVIDRTNIRTIIITDEKFNIIYADGFGEEQYNKSSKQFNLSNRAYLKELALFPEKEVIGNIIEGILTKAPSLPIAVAIRNHDTNFKGAIIFSINLKKFGNGFLDDNVASISLEHRYDSHSAVEKYYYLKNNNIRFFLSNVLLNPNNMNDFAFKQQLNDSLIIITYNNTHIKSSFLKNLLPIIIILSLIFGFLTWFFKYVILKPIMPVLAPEVGPTSLISIDRHFFSNVANLLSSRQVLIEQNNVYQEKYKLIIKMLECCAIFKRLAVNKAELFTEEIEEMLLESDEYDELKDLYKNNLKRLYQVSLSSQEQLFNLSSTTSQIIYNLNITQKQELSIIKLLINAGIDSSLFQNNDSYRLDLDDSQFKGIFFADLMILFLQNVVKYLNNIGNLHSIALYNNNDHFQINMLLKEKLEVKDLEHEASLTRARLLAIANYATINTKVNLIAKTSYITLTIPKNAFVNL